LAGTTSKGFEVSKITGWPPASACTCAGGSTSTAAAPLVIFMAIGRRAA